MKLTKSHLKKIIREELDKAIVDAAKSSDPDKLFRQGVKIEQNLVLKNLKDAAFYILKATKALKGEKLAAWGKSVSSALKKANSALALDDLIKAMQPLKGGGLDGAIKNIILSLDKGELKVDEKTAKNIANVLASGGEGGRLAPRQFASLAEKREDPPYRERGSTESGAQQMAAGIAYSCRSKRGKERDKCEAKLKARGGSAWELYSGEITYKELRNLATLGQKVKGHKAKEPEHRKDLPKYATLAKD